MNVKSSNHAWEIIRSRPEMYLLAGGLSLQSKLVSLLVMDCLALGANDVAVVRDENWAAVYSGTNWLARGRFGDLALPSLFNSLVPFPEAGVNSVRHEAVVAAFSDEVCVFQGGALQYLVTNSTPCAIDANIVGVLEGASDVVAVVFRCKSGVESPLIETADIAEPGQFLPFNTSAGIKSKT